jgi:uncharacterized protein
LKNKKQKKFATIIIMKCPICNVNLVMSDRQGIEIDYCPECRGVWLDRGELDKLIEKSASHTSQQVSRPQQEPTYHQTNTYQNHTPDNHQQHNNYQHKKKESWLGDVFDF